METQLCVRDTPITVSEGMENMSMMTDIETIRAEEDFVYAMLYSPAWCEERSNPANPAEKLPSYREWYHTMIAVRLLPYLGRRLDGRPNVVVQCIRKFVDIPPDTVLDPEFAYTGPADKKREELLLQWEILCAAILSNHYPADAVARGEERKRGQDVLLFMNLAYNPPFLRWLYTCDAATNPQDVTVLAPDLLVQFATAIAAQNLYLFGTAAIGYGVVAELLRGCYVPYTDVYNPDMDSRDDGVPDIPEDYEMGID
jgi:hypothetical protein